MFFDLYKTTIFLVEQNANLALKVAHRGDVMETGRVAFSDTADNLMANDEVRKAYLGVYTAFHNNVPKCRSAA